MGHAIIQQVDQINNNFEKDQYTLGVFIDLSKVFDTDDHKILIGKIENLGIKEINLLWFQSYLENRKNKYNMTYQAPLTKVLYVVFHKAQYLGCYYFLFI